MTNSNEELSQLFQNRVEFKQYIKKLKEKILKNQDNESYIVLFMLLVTELEYRLKECLVFYYNNTKYYDRGLGGTIKEFSNVIKKFDKNNIKDYRIKPFFEKPYYEHFLNHCREIKTLRNNLYHNLFKESEKGGENLQEIIKGIKQYTEIHDVSYKIDSTFYQDNSPYKNLPTLKRVINENDVPSQWTLELLIEISKIYLKGIINIKHNQSTCLDKKEA